VFGWRVAIVTLPCEKHLGGDLVARGEGDADAGDAPYRPYKSVVGEQQRR